MTFPNNYSNHKVLVNRKKEPKELSAGQQKRREVPINPGRNRENCEAVETLMEASPKANELFGKPGMDCNEENVACEKGAADMIGKNDENIENPDIASSDKTEGIEEIEEDDLIFLPLRRKAALPDGKYHAVIKEIIAETRVGVYGKFISIRMKFEICHDEKRITINFLTHKDSKPTGKLFKIIKSILGEVPSNGLDLRTLKGKEVLVELGHRVDENGNTWEEVLNAEKYNANQPVHC